MSNTEPAQELYVTRDQEGCWRVEGDPTPLCTNLTSKPPLLLSDAIERRTGSRPVGYARVTGPRGLLRFRVRW